MRVAVVDIGTNSTRLLVCEVTEEGAVDELERLTTVTRLGQGVDASGSLAQDAMQRVFTTLPAKGLVTEIECETRDRAHLDRLFAALRDGGYDVAPVELA